MIRLGAGGSKSAQVLQQCFDEKGAGEGDKDGSISTRPLVGQTEQHGCV